MSDDNKVSSILDRFAKPISPEAAARLAPSPVPSKVEYRAAEPFLGDARSRMLRIYYSNGKWELLSYGTLLSVLSDSPGHLALIFATGVVELLGDDLRLLFDAVQDHEIRSLTPFNIKLHHAPDEDEPIIHTIEFKNVQPR